MTTAQDIATASVDAFNAHDEDRFRSLFGAGAVLEAPGDVLREGAEASVKYALAWLHAFPDARIRVETEVADGDWVAQRIVFEGTHEDTLVGPEGMIPATRRQVRIRGMEFIRVEDGLIVEDHLCFDQTQLMTQLGPVQELAFRA
jgi:predicted ester cyclase